MAGTGRPRTHPILTGLDATLLAQRESLVTERRPRRPLPIAAAAYYLSVSRATIERLVNRGELPTVKVVGPPGTTLRTSSSSSPSTSAAFARGQSETVSLRVFIERKGEGS
jgi:excisionase family DNA binding protein